MERVKPRQKEDFRHLALVSEPSRQGSISFHEVQGTDKHKQKGNGGGVQLMANISSDRMCLSSGKRSSPKR